MSSTLTMVKTVCCEGYKIYGKRCSLCPHRPENQEALEAYRAASRTFCSYSDAALCSAVPAPPSAEETLVARQP